MVYDAIKPLHFGGFIKYCRSKQKNHFKTITNKLSRECILDCLLLVMPYARVENDFFIYTYKGLLKCNLQEFEFIFDHIDRFNIKKEKKINVALVEKDCN